MEAIRTVPSTIWMWSLRLMLLLCGWWGYGWWWYDLGDGGHNDHVDEVFRVRVFFFRVTVGIVVGMVRSGQ